MPYNFNHGLTAKELATESPAFRGKTVAWQFDNGYQILKKLRERGTQSTSYDELRAFVPHPETLDSDLQYLLQWRSSVDDDALVEKDPGKTNHYRLTVSGYHAGQGGPWS